MAKPTYSQETVDTKLPRLTAWRYTGNAIRNINQMSVGDESVTFVSGYVKQYAEVGDIVYFYDANDSVLYAIGQVTEVRANQPTIMVLGRNALLNNGLTYNSDGQLEVKPDYDTLKFIGSALMAVGQSDYDPTDTRPISGEGVAQAIKNDLEITAVVTDVSAEQTGTFNYDNSTNSTPASYIPMQDGAITVDLEANTITVDFTKLNSRALAGATFTVSGAKKPWKAGEDHALDDFSATSIEMPAWELFQCSINYNSSSAQSVPILGKCTGSWDEATRIMTCTPEMPLVQAEAIIASFGAMSGNPVTYEVNIAQVSTAGSTQNAASIDSLTKHFASKSELPAESHGLKSYTGATNVTFDNAADLKDFIENELSFSCNNNPDSCNVTVTYTGESEAANISIYLRHVKNIAVNLVFRGAGASSIALTIQDCSGASSSTNGAVTIKSYSTSAIYTLRSIAAFNTSLYISNISTSGTVMLYNSPTYFANTSGSAVATFGALSINQGSFVSLKYNASFGSLTNTNTGGILNIDDGWTGSFTTAPAAVHSVAIFDQRTDHPLETYARKAAT